MGSVAILFIYFHLLIVLKTSKDYRHDSFYSNSEVGKSCPKGQIQPIVYFENKFLLEWSHAHVSLAANSLQRQS